jgi:hypothetical protein
MAPAVGNIHVFKLKSAFYGRINFLVRKAVRFFGTIKKALRRTTSDQPTEEKICAAKRENNN